MSVDKEPRSGRAWRPSMPRRGKSILLDARDFAEQYGWTDEPIAAIHAARDAGWTLQEIGDVLGCSREYVRQLYARDADPAAAINNFPAKPKRPQKPRPGPGPRELARSLVSDAEINELCARGRDGNDEYAAAAEEMYRRVAHLDALGVPIGWLSKRMGLATSTLKQGLGRYGYRPIPPSQRQVRTGGTAR